MPSEAEAGLLEGICREAKSQDSSTSRGLAAVVTSTGANAGAAGHVRHDHADRPRREGGTVDGLCDCGTRQQQGGGGGQHGAPHVPQAVAVEGRFRTHHDLSILGED
jgi:hypothetical protein